MNENKKTVDIHRDYELSQMCFAVNTLLHLCLHHMQNHTDYGKEYKACYEFFSNVILQDLDKFEELLAYCVDTDTYKIER